MSKPIVLCIMDGIGVGNHDQYDAYYNAKTPTLDYLKEKYACSHLKCSGPDVGLPDHQMGNSEVGHLNIGAGRVVHQSLTLINEAIKDDSFNHNKAFLDAINHALKKKKALHVMGLLSDGGVHSHIDHLKALLKLISLYPLKEVYLHLFLDGRDTLFDSGIGYLRDIMAYTKELGVGQISSISGRYYAMDRDRNFDRNQLTYDVMVNRHGAHFDDPISYIEKSYQEEVYDEFVIPAYNQKVDARISDDDSVIFFNFRPDRAIQMSHLLTNPDYDASFANQPQNLCFVSMMEYDQKLNVPVAFTREKLVNVLGVYLADHNYTQLRIAETEKYAHVTFFFDGQVNYDGANNPELKGCQRVLIPSPSVKTYDLKPEMSAIPLTDKLLEILDKKATDVVILNFANGDMVGHTGNYQASIKAVECVDTCIKRIYNKIKEDAGIMLITADHGNVEMMKDRQKKTITSHTSNVVECIVTKEDITLADGRLADIAPTILTLLDLEKPPQMSGKSLIRET